MNMNININEQLLDAVDKNNLLNVQELVLNGADVNYRNIIGNTPLHLCRSNKIAQFLILNGADINCVNNNGSTPLHLCEYIQIEQGVMAIVDNIKYYDRIFNFSCSLIYVKMLLENGADIHIKNDEGLSVYDIAIKSKNYKLIELFEYYNAISNGLDIKEPCSE